MNNVCTIINCRHQWAALTITLTWFQAVTDDDDGGGGGGAVLTGNCRSVAAACVRDWLVVVRQVYSRVVGLKDLVCSRLDCVNGKPVRRWRAGTPETHRKERERQR